MANMYERIEGLCKDRGITITEMCRELKINRSSLSELKQGRAKSLSTDKVVKIARFFGVTAEYIVDEDNSIMLETQNQPVYLDQETRDIIDTLRSRPEIKLLFNSAKNVSKDDVDFAIKMLEKFKK